MSTVVVNGSDPEVYLPNGARIALGLIGESTRPESIVQAAQDGYFTATGQWIYVSGMSNVASPPAPTIGTVKIDGTTDVETGAATELSCTFSGKATDATYRWSTGCGSISIVGPKTNKTVQVSGISATNPGGGNCWILCAVSSTTASDGPTNGQASVTVTDPPSPAKVVTKTAK